MQVRGTFPELYDNIDKTVKTIIRDTLAELPAVWREVFNVKSSEKKFERYQTVVPMGDVPEKGEGEVYALDMIRPGWQKDFLHLEFGLGFEVTETAQEDDQHDMIVRSSEMLAFSARYLQEKRAADALNLGFTTEKTPDGVSLFNTAHVLKGGGTAKNRPSADADLSPASLMQAFIDLGTETKIESGQMVSSATAFKLVVPSALEFVADRIVNSTLMSGTAENDRNSIKARRSIDIVVWNHLTDPDAWFLVASNKKLHGLLSYIRIPIKKSPTRVDPFTENVIEKIRFRQSWGAWMWQNTYGTTGA